MQVWLRTLHVTELGVTLLDGGVLTTMFSKGIAGMYVNVLPYLWALGPGRGVHGHASLSPELCVLSVKVDFLQWWAPTGDGNLLGRLDERLRKFLEPRSYRQ
ncbi:hypothetical protein LZY01_24340 [Levilactobacillus zymae]|uniref:Uncharacterized protein n=1 Tax=Levilactobacillus zymae TaxID=267363 RepID=A0ABQ0X1Y7_9LACO|nr:hypothetical protein LZY01_24340 [Levilactobacillus zymae]